MFGDGYVHKADAAPIGAREKDALAVLDLEHPSDKAKIKAHAVYVKRREEAFVKQFNRLTNYLKGKI